MVEAGSSEGRSSFVTLFGRFDRPSLLRIH
jgi:hypothetical protein